MFGGFGGFGGGGNDPNQQPGGGFPGMNMNANFGFNSNATTTHTTTTTTGGQGMGGGFGGPGGEDPGKKSKDMQDRYKYREEKLPTYNALVDVLEIKGEDVSFSNLVEKNLLQTNTNANLFLFR